jgi:hypothetical protein
MSNDPNEHNERLPDDSFVYLPIEDIYSIERAIDKMERAREELIKAAEEMGAGKETKVDNDE